MWRAFLLLVGLAAFFGSPGIFAAAIVFGCLLFVGGVVARNRLSTKMGQAPIGE
jgi:hypothetical protein